MKLIGVDIPDKKRVVIALTYFVGIGLSMSKKILKTLNIDENTKTKDLTGEQINAIQSYINDNFKVEGDLRREIGENVARLINIACYRGIRHMHGLPLRGQKTRNKGGTKRKERRKKRVL